MHKSERILSIDIFRGLVIVLMVFVNYQQWMKGSPDILQHALKGVDKITIADVVFPFFIFAVGLCIPMALEKRISKGYAKKALVFDILKRGAMLLFLGVVTDNWMHSYSEEHGLLGKYVWSSLFYTAIFLFLPRWRNKKVNVTLKSIATALALFLIIIYRDKTGDWKLETGWWGILGMIGWTYTFCSLLYLGIRDRAMVWMGLIGVATLYYNAVIHWSIPFGQNPDGFLKHADIFGSHTTITIVGILAGIGIYKKAFDYKVMTLISAVLMALGQLLRQINGANKIDGTDAYCLITASMALMSFIVVHFLCSKIKLKESSFMVLIGTNALAVYFLQGYTWVVMNSFGVKQYFWPVWIDGGVLGMSNVIIMMTLTITLAVGMTKRNMTLTA